MPSVNVVNGKQIVVEDLGAAQRVVRFAVKPFLQMWHHRDLIQAILRREVSERFKGSAAGWVCVPDISSACARNFTDCPPCTTMK